MEGELRCFNCGTPTDLVTDAYGPVCRNCLNARKGGPAPEGEAQDYTELTVDELRDILRDRDLAVGGTKAELVERLNEDDEQAEE